MLVYAKRADSLTFFHGPIFFKRIVHLLGRIQYTETAVWHYKICIGLFYIILIW